MCDSEVERKKKTTGVQTTALILLVHAYVTSVWQRQMMCGRSGEASKIKDISSGIKIKIAGL